MVAPDPAAGQPAGPDTARDDLQSYDAGRIADRISAARFDAAADPVAVTEPWLSSLVSPAAAGSARAGPGPAGGAGPDAAGHPRLARVALLGQDAQAKLRLGQVSGCLTALARQRAAAGPDQVALVWALTTSAACRAIFGQLGQARADLAEVRHTCHYSAPLLAEPFWRFAEVVCQWLGGDWPTARDGAEALHASQLSPLTPAVAGVLIALRMELLRGLGLPGESMLLAGRLAATAPAELSAWAQAGLDADQGRPGAAMRRLADVCDAGTRPVYRVALPLVLHRMADIAYCGGDRQVTEAAAAALARLDQAAPLTEILTGLARSYATGDPGPARCAEHLAETQGAALLTAEALTVRGRIGDQPASTLPAAHAIWWRIGAVGKARAVAAAIRAAGLPAPVPDQRCGAGEPGRGPALLTPRERCLVRLVHEGRTNQQIARIMHISVKTVEAYLTRVYRKTSCSSRVELAVAVTERRIHLD